MLQNGQFFKTEILYINVSSKEKDNKKIKTKMEKTKIIVNSI